MSPLLASAEVRTLFEAVPGLYLVLDPALRIVAVTDAYLKATLTRRDTILGRGIFDVFPDNPADPGAGGAGILEASLRRVLRHGVEDVMAVQKYDIPRSAEDGGGFEARYWSPFNSPVLAPDGSVAFIIHRVEDVTEYVRLSSSGQASLSGSRALQQEADIYARAHEIALTHSVLEQRVSERTRELEIANQTLQESRREALALLEEAVRERQKAETSLARTQVLLGHLHLLDQITRLIGERLDLANIFEVVVDTLEQRLPLDFACVCLQTRDDSGLGLGYAGKQIPALHAQLMQDGGVGLIGKDGLARCMAGELVHEADITLLPFSFPQQLARHGLRALVLAPLRLESRVFGMLVAARREARSFSSSDCEFLRQLAEHVALAAQQAQLYGALQEAYEELRQTQQVAMQQERLRALGQMASGIAHDINNALTPASLYTDALLEQEAGLSPQARHHLEIVQRAVDDVAHTVARLRDFYAPREAPQVLVPVQLNQLAGQVLDLTRARWSNMQQMKGAVVEAATELEAGLPTVLGVESEIREALTNLVLNAVDAMPDGGRLVLRTYLSTDVPARVCIDVADTGVGMDEATRQRCLEPFFSTKGTRGTGLGLAMVFGIVRRHGAELGITSAPGAGTTVSLQFALPGRQAGPDGDTVVRAVKVGPLPLLVVDDDPVLLKCLRYGLESEGHRVVCCNGGDAGITAFREALARNEPFAAVITDLGMPYVDGRRVAAAVQEAAPATPVLLLTGWGQRLIAEGDVPPGVARVLAKPPKLRDLRQALAELCQA